MLPGIKVHSYQSTDFYHRDSNREHSMSGGCSSFRLIPTPSEIPRSVKYQRCTHHKTNTDISPIPTSGSKIYFSHFAIDSLLQNSIVITHKHLPAAGGWVRTRLFWRNYRGLVASFVAYGDVITPVL